MSADCGKLEVDVLHAKVTWSLPNGELQVPHDECISRHVDFLELQLKLQLYPKGCGQLNRPLVLLENVDTAELQVRVSINGWVAFTQHIPRDGQLQREYHSEIKDEDLEIVIELYQVDRQPMRDVLPRLLKSELDIEQTNRKDAEAESDRLRALIHAASNQATNRVCHLTRSALKIQAKWRQVMVHHQFQRDRAETDRRLKQAKFVKAITVLQCLWRLRRKKCERRWLRAQKGCSETETPYDAILAFDSLAEFLKEGKIDFLQKAESLLEVAKESRYRIVAVVGLFDKGKTWLLNKLFGANLPAGKLCTTRGLSFLWFKERRMLVIDSAGVQSTVSYRAQAVDAIHDAQTTESLMFEMVSRISHQIVFVVNDLTWFEQKYVAMLHQKYVQCKQHKELTVVHNLRNTSDTEEATMLFSRQVMQCYDGELSHLGRLIFTADLGEGVPPVHHIGLCYEFSKAGDAFNAKNREHLLQRLEHGNTLGTSIVLTDLLKAELSRLLPKFVNIETTEPEACGAASGQPISVSLVPAAAADVAGNGYASSGAFCMRLSHEKARVTTKTRGVISPLGEIIAHDVSFDPIVNVFDKENGNGMHRFIRIECPGVVEEEITCFDDVPNGVKVFINKKPPIVEHAVHEVEPIRQTHGAWEREFSFDQSEGCFKPCEDETTLEHGVLTIVLKKTVPRKWGVGKARNLVRPSDVPESGRAASPTASECTLKSWNLEAMPPRAAGA